MAIYRRNNIWSVFWNMKIEQAAYVTQENGFLVNFMRFFHYWKNIKKYAWESMKTFVSRTAFFWFFWSACYVRNIDSNQSFFQKCSNSVQSYKTFKPNTIIAWIYIQIGNIRFNFQIIFMFAIHFNSARWKNFPSTANKKNTFFCWWMCDACVAWGIFGISL